MVQRFSRRMPHSSLIFTLFSLTSVLYGSNAQQRPPASACTDRYANTRLHCAVPIKSCPETASEQACAEECMNLPNCASALYTIDTRLCELYDIAKVPTRFRRSQQLLNRFRRQDDTGSDSGSSSGSMAQQPQDDSPNGPLLNDFGDPYATTTVPSGPSPQGTTCYGQGPFLSSCAGYTYFIKQAGRYGCNNPVTYGPPVTNPPVTNPPVTNPPTNPPPPPATTTRATPATTKATQATTKPPATTTPSRSTRAVTTASTTGFIVIPGRVTCQVDESVRFLKVDGKRLSDTPDTSFTAQSEAECYTACGNNKLPSGQQAPCQSVSFDKTTMSCGISTNAATPTGTGRATDDPNSVYYEKFCIKKSDEGSCPATFLVDPQHVLVGFARAVVTTNTEGECLNECLNSVKNFGFVCLSGMFFSQDSQCVLNTESRTTQPDLYTPENEDVVDYFEPGCTQAPPITGESFPPRVGAGLGGQQNDNAPQEAPSSTKGKGSILSIFNKNLANDTWGQWTACDRRSNTQKRFKGCTRMSPKSCQDQQEHKCEQRAQKTRNSHKKHPRRQSRDTPINQEVSGTNSIGPVLTPMLSRNMDPLIIEGSGESKATATSTQGPEAISTLQIPSNVPEAAVSDAEATESASTPSQDSITSSAFQQSPVPDPDVVRDVPALESTKPEAVSPENPRTQKSMLSSENQIESSSERISRADAKNNATEKKISAETPSPTISPGLANVTAVINFWLPKEQWAPWTPCDKRTATQRRFRACNTMNPNSCGYHEQQKNCTYHDETGKNVTSTTPTLPRNSTPSSGEPRNAASTSHRPLIPPALHKVGHSIRDQLSRQQRLEPDNSLLVGFEGTDDSSNETGMLIPPADLVDVSDYQDFPKVNRSKPSAPSPPNKGPILDPHASINGSIPGLIPPTLLPPIHATTTIGSKASSTTGTSSASSSLLNSTTTTAPSNQFEFEITTAPGPDIPMNNETTTATTEEPEPALPGNFTFPTPSNPGTATPMTSSVPSLPVGSTEPPAKMPPGPTTVTPQRPTPKSPGATPTMPIDPIDFMQTRTAAIASTTTDQPLTRESSPVTSTSSKMTPPSPPQRSTTSAAVPSSVATTTSESFNSSVANNLPSLSTTTVSPAETEATDETTGTLAVTDDISELPTKLTSVTTSPAILRSTVQVTGATPPQPKDSTTLPKSATGSTTGAGPTTASAKTTTGSSAAAMSLTTTVAVPTIEAGSPSPGGLTKGAQANVTMATTALPLSTKVSVLTPTTTAAVADQQLGVDASSRPPHGATYGATAKTAETTSMAAKLTMTTAATTKALPTTAATSKASTIVTTSATLSATTTTATTSRLPTTASKGVPTKTTSSAMPTSTSKTSNKTATTSAPKAEITAASTTIAHTSLAATIPKAISDTPAHPTYGSITRLPQGQAQQESTTAETLISPASVIGSSLNKTKPVSDGNVTKMPGTSGEAPDNGTDSTGATTVSPQKYTPIINALLPPTVWGPWAACDRRTGMQKRYRGCKRMSPNSCAEHESRSCEFEGDHSPFAGNLSATIIPPTPMPDKAVAVRL